MKSERFTFIDILRGFSIAVVIILHCLANYLNEKTALFIWDYLQFAVQLFVFCGAYVFFKYPPQLTQKALDVYIIKRFKRLYLPYAGFLAIYFLLLFFLEPAKFKLDFFLKSVFVIGGIDINWLVLLFFQFAILFPVLEYFRQKNRAALAIYSGIAISTAIALFFWKFPYDWKLIMWLPWSLLGLYSIYFIENEKHVGRLNRSFVFAMTGYVLVLCVQYISNQSLAIYINKYPPNVMILLYGIVWIGIMYQLYRTDFFNTLKLTAPLEYLSKKSYSLFFIHYIVIFVCNKAASFNEILPWYGYTPVIFILSIGVQASFDILREKFSSK